MERRQFLAAAGMAAAMGAAAQAQPAGQAEANQYIELRKYITMPGPGKKVLEDYLRKAAIPAWNRLGIKPVGVMTINYGLNSPPAIFVLIPHPSLESVVATPRKLQEDAEYMKAAEEFLNTPIDQPAFYRLETSILRAFDKMPQIEQPLSAETKGRIFQLRIYESHNPAKAKKKIQMFNEGGEIGIFKKTGMNPVMFAETIAGPAMPNLHYLLCFESAEQRDKAWETFRADPDWDKLKSDPQYKESVSNISDIILKPTGYSQL